MENKCKYSNTVFCHEDCSILANTKKETARDAKNIRNMAKCIVRLNREKKELVQLYLKLESAHKELYDFMIKLLNENQKMKEAIGGADLDGDRNIKSFDQL